MKLDSSASTSSSSGSYTTAINASSLLDIGNSPNPIAWPLASFVADALSPNSGLGDLLNARLTDASIYHEKDSPHEYLIAFIQTPSQYSDLPGGIWLRCERFPIRTNLLKIASSASVNADDKVSLSFHFQQLTKLGKDKIIMQSKLEDARLYHLVDLLFTIHRNSPLYTLKSQNCWFFAATIVSALQFLRQTWLVLPKTSWAKKMLQGLESEVQKVSTTVHNTFLSHWTDGKSNSESSVLLNRAWLTPAIRPAATLIQINEISNVVAIIQSKPLSTGPTEAPPQTSLVVVQRQDLVITTSSADFADQTPPLDKPKSSRRKVSSSKVKVLENVVERRDEISVATDVPKLRRVAKSPEARQSTDRKTSDQTISERESTRTSSSQADDSTVSSPNSQLSEARRSSTSLVEEDDTMISNTRRDSTERSAASPRIHSPARSDSTNGKTRIHTEADVEGSEDEDEEKKDMCQDNASEPDDSVPSSPRRSGEDVASDDSEPESPSTSQQIVSRRSNSETDNWDGERLFKMVKKGLKRTDDALTKYVDPHVDALVEKSRPLGKSLRNFWRDL